VPEPSFEDFRKTIALVFHADETSISRETSARDVDGWDSISHALLIMTIEEVYNIAFSDDEIYAFPNVGALYDRTLERVDERR
jgi:acyl carrier protein